MGKIDTLNGYIEECEKYSEFDIEREANARISDSDLVQRIISTYCNEIDNICTGLSIYFGAETTFGDINILKSKLINYRDNIEANEAKELRELEVLRLEKSKTYTNNINNNIAPNNLININIEVSIKNAIERLQALPNTISQEDKDALEEKLTALQVALDNRDNDKAKLKLTNVLKYIGDKCVDAGIAVLPYLGQIAATL